LGIVPSRQIISKYNERRKLIEEQVGRINGRYSTLQWQPIIYRYNHIPFDELCALYQAADIGLITPLRDGMNLVAKEYIASRANHQGVLILSELAGAASELGEAIMVNPMDGEELSSAIYKALNIPLKDQRHQIALMQKRLIDYDVKRWVEDFLTQLNGIKAQQESQQMKFINGENLISFLTSFNAASSKHLFLDYDGTLVPFARHPREASPSAELLDLLRLLTGLRDTTVTIISGRDSTILESWFGDLPINMVAEHGASIREIGSDWVHESESDQSWKPMIRPVMELSAQRCPGSFVEEKGHTLAWHYRNVDRDLGFNRSRELLDNLYHLIRDAQLQVIDGNKVIEVRVAGVDKGYAAKKVLAKNPADFVFVIGDDKTDEDMFKALADKAITVKVGSGPTEAHYCIPLQADVASLLKNFFQQQKSYL
jgi:trehalose 6-phosphate synthase/phosphatase